MTGDWCLNDLRVKRFIECGPIYGKVETVLQLKGLTLYGFYVENCRVQF